MALTESTMMKLGTEAPSFNLLDTISDKMISLDELKSDKAMVILFICNHCPYVIHINEKLVEVAKNYQEKGVQFIAISSNDVEKYPEDSPEKMKQLANDLGYSFPYLYDESQEIARAYGAVCTPDLFVFDADLKCAYRGRFDETRPNMGEPTGKDLTDALDAILAGTEVNSKQYPSMGCNIKWKTVS